MENLLALRLGRDRADLGGPLHRVAEARGLGQGHDLGRHLLIDGALHEKTGAGDAGLAGGREDAGDRALHGIVDVGVGEDDVRRLAAELERDVLDALRRGRVDRGAGRIAAGEGDLGDRGCSTRAAPISEPKPVTVLITPSGKPASLTSSIRASVEQDVNSDGLMTMVLPAASAGASFQVRSSRGEFHGVIATTTPSGSRLV